MAGDTISKQSFDSSSTAAIQFAVADSEENFLQAVNGLDDDNPTSFYIHASELLIAFSSRADWVIFGSREADIAICAISDPTVFNIFSSIYGSDLLNEVEDVADVAYGASGDIAKKEKIRQNYSSLA